MSICSCSFSFCLASQIAFLLPNYLYTSIPHPAPLPSPAFLRMIHSSHHDHPCTLPALFRGVHMLQIHAFLTHLLLFLSCFCFPLCPCIHPHPSAPMYAHLHPLTSLFAKLAKTWCPGKFPRPWPLKYALQVHFCLFLSCFHAPPCILCPNAPIRTHIDPFVSVITRLHSIFHVYIYNLIKK